MFNACKAQVTYTLGHESKATRFCVMHTHIQIVHVCGQSGGLRGHRLRDVSAQAFPAINYPHVHSGEGVDSEAA